MSHTTVGVNVNKSRDNEAVFFHWRGGYLTREVLADLVNIFDEAGKSKGKEALISVNWAQAVIRVRFEAGAGCEQIEMEEANEGEI